MMRLFDPRQGDKPFLLRSLSEDQGAAHCSQQSNYFSIYFLTRGSGTLWSDAMRFEFAANSLLFFAPYRRIKFEMEDPWQGNWILFHANYLCVETFHAESGCSGLLFNDPFGDPTVPLQPSERPRVAEIVAQIEKEQTLEEIGHNDAVLAYLKLLLIAATRSKLATASEHSASTLDTPSRFYKIPLLMEFQELIEREYRSMHAPKQYAKRLNVSEKSLGRLVRIHLGTTPTNLIRNRIISHAKWQFLHTLRSVKEVAMELGFSDELYFSRMFKRAVGLSPSHFRDFETEIRGGSNLSMVLSDPSIPSAIAKSHT